MTKQITSLEQIERSVKNLAEKEGYRNHKTKIKQLSRNDKYSTSDLFSVDIIAEDKTPLNVFVKIAKTAIAKKEIRREVLVYTELSKVFKDIEDKYDLKDKKLYKFPKYYSSDLTDTDNIVVIENLIHQGYIQSNRLKSISWEYAKKALEEISKFHALSFTLKIENPNAYEKLAENFSGSVNFEHNKILCELLVDFLPAAVQCIEEEHQPLLQKYIDENKNRFYKDQFLSTSKYTVFLHGDYRSCNILAQHQDDELISLIPVHYQRVYCGSPLNDVVCLLFTGTDEMFRRQHMEQYFDYYHDCLASHLQLLSKDVNLIFPKSAYYFELKEKLRYGLETALLTMNKDLLNENNVPTEESPRGLTITAQIGNLKPSQLYAERLNGIMKDLIKWGFFEENRNQLLTEETNVAGDMKKNGPIEIMKEQIIDIANREGYKNFKLKITAVSTEGANYTADLFNVQICEENKQTLNLFVKLCNATEKVRKVIQIKMSYQNEIFAYTSLADVFNTFQEKHKVPEEMRFHFPKYYGSSLKEKEEMIIVDNLVSRGFKLHDRLKPINWEYAKAAVEEIAKFHALSFALKKQDPNTFKRLFDNLPIDYLKDAYQKFAESAVQEVLKTINIIEKENRSKLQNYLDANKNTFLIKHLKLASKYSSLVHGDYRVSNIMVKYEGEKLIALKPVDYQTVTYGCPINDILYLLFLGSDENFRRHYFEQYLEHYHNTLAKYLKLLSEDVNYIYPKSIFYFELKEQMLFGLEIALAILKVILIEKENVNVEKTIEGLMNPEVSIEESKPSDQMVETINGIVRDYVRWGFLKDESNFTKDDVQNPNKNTYDLNRNEQTKMIDKETKCCIIL